MPSEKEIDNYIDNMEEENVIYVDKELEYADKCHKLTEQLGCPLEVVFEATRKGFFDKEGKHYVAGQNIEIELHLDTDNLKYSLIIVYECIESAPATYVILADFWISDYKKTWWLKEDKSE